ncbi:class I SAM-dependent methyltransferase [Thermomonospora umbrina]|uniref:Methyltransferase family protein n=1 Tax=Thermomonospora umbrina TaxID=111806 RepID=A0A3D9SKA1_9ACTN|nr:class I SAM-dependent methyltransferase [Thermomonospora umbrina]REE96356.1 methyltransferase family protein [Thermomonospora umbrina]
MPPTTANRRRTVVSPHVARLVDFAEPSPADDCLDLSCGPGPLPDALGPLVRHVTAVDGTPLSPPGAGPDGRTPTVLFGRSRLHVGALDTPTVRARATALPYRSAAFTLVTSRFSLSGLGDPAQVLREMARVCRPGGRLVIAEVVRPSGYGREHDRLERLRDPAHPGTPTLARLVELLSEAGARVRGIERFNVERPLEPWLAAAPDQNGVERVRHALVDEIEGGPRSGARPRVISGELWFTQTWAHLTARV